VTIRKSTLQNLFLGAGIIIAGIFVAVLLTTGVSKPAEAVVLGLDMPQVITITAKAGYTPNQVTAQANLGSILRIVTDKTYDCTSTLRIPQLNVNRLLPNSGVTEIPVVAQAPGSEITGTCSMGMYKFTIKFI